MDDDLRELERRANLGDPAAAATLLRARLRVGQVSEEAVRLLARLGDPAALTLHPDEDWPKLDETYPALVALDPILGLRALVAAVAAGLPRFQRWLPSDFAVASALDACEVWLEARADPVLVAAALEAAQERAPRARESVNLVNHQLLGRFRIGQLSGSELRALEYTAWTARDAAEGVVRLSTGELPSGDSLIRLVGLWNDSDWGDLRVPLREALRPWLCPGSV